MKIARESVLTLILVVSFLTACGQGIDIDEYSSVASPIIGGIQVADGKWPAVGAIALKNDSMCTGTLISPKIVVTAAHCIVDDDWWLFTLGFDMANGTDYEVERAVAHRDYDPGNNTDQNPGRHDVGVLVLKEGVTDVTPARLFSGTFSTLNNKNITFVGYGLNDDQSVEESYGLKYEVTLKIADITTTGFWNYTNPDDPHNTCGGDSGGPGFVADGNGGYVIAGFVSSGDEYCQYDGFNMRADDNAAWITEMIHTYDPDYVIPAQCGNGECEEDENAVNCAEDCEVIADSVSEDIIESTDATDSETEDDSFSSTDLPPAEDTAFDYSAPDMLTEIGTDARQCPDGICQAGEDCVSCPQDCGQCDDASGIDDSELDAGDVTPPVSSGGCAAGTVPQNATAMLIVLAFGGLMIVARKGRRCA